MPSDAELLDTLRDAHASFDKAKAQLDEQQKVTNKIRRDITAKQTALLKAYQQIVTKLNKDK